MGTMVSFHVRPGDCPSDEARRAVEHGCQMLHDVDAVFSTWRPESLLSRLRRGEASLSEMPTQVTEVIELCYRAKVLSQGWFDPWAIPGGFDPTGLVKGWSLDKVMNALKGAGIEAALLNAGGDLAAFGSPGPGEVWRIGIRHPWIADGLACVVRLDSAIATSGTYERGPHLIDPRTGCPVRATASSTVTGPNLAMSDALATALAIGKDEVLEGLSSIDGYEGYLIRGDGSERFTDSMAFLDQ